MEEEKQLLKQIQNGDTESFSVLVDTYGKRVYFQALQITGNKQDAEEVAQDAFIKAFKSIRSFRGDAAFSTWLYKIVHFTALNHIRKRKQTTDISTEKQLENDSGSAIQHLEENDRKLYLKKAINSLHPTDKSLITLFYLEEKSIKEIEKITMLSSSNIKVKLMRIRKQLQAALSQELKNEALSLINN